MRQLVSDLNASPMAPGCEVVVAPPSLYLLTVASTLDPARFAVAAQNVWKSGPGAFTGEVAAEQLADAGLGWAIVGHSERRALLGESHDLVGAKAAHALGAGLSVIVCCGESLAEREAGHTLATVTAQLAAVAAAVPDAAHWAKVVVAYEPVWAIGTGKVATPAQAQEVHAAIRAWLASTFGPAVARSVRIQYGGSVTAGNAAELARQEDLDGFLVGGASLKAHDFAAICATAEVHAEAVKAIA